MERPTHYILNSGNGEIDILCVREARDFRGGAPAPVRMKMWRPIVAASVGDARRKGAKMFGVKLPALYADEA